MKQSAINKILEEFDTIEDITPSENWDFVFENKMNNSRLSKSNTITNFSLMLLLLIALNIGFIWNSFKTVNLKNVQDKEVKYRTIADELLIASNN